MIDAAIERKQTTKESKRCPVFKIDLKGHFVNIDDLTSDLIGLPDENLFGRNIKEFLDKDSNRKLIEIIQYGNRFDSCYESIELVIIDNKKKQHKHNAIVSLNFIAGNPSNYQVILMESNQLDSATENRTNNIELILKKLFELFSDFARNADWQKLAELLLKNMQFSQVGIYKYIDSGLALLSDSSEQKGKSKVDFSVTDEKHLQVITDHKQTVISDNENESIEYSCPLIFDNSCWGLIRCVASEESTGIEEELALVTSYVGPVFGVYIKSHSQIEEKPTGPETNIFEILKMFGCTIISIDAENNLLSTYSDFPDKDHILAGCTNVTDLIERLSSFELIGFSGNDSVEIKLSDEHPVVFPDLGMISNETKFYLYKILDTRELLGGVSEYTIVIFPEFDNSIGRKTSEKLLSMFLETVTIFLEPIDKCAAKMAGQYYPRLNKDGRFYLDSIQDNCHVLYRTISRFRQLCEIVNRKENQTEINLTEIITRSIKEFQRIENDLKIDLENSGQIYLMADATRISETLNAVFAGLISQTISDESPVISIKVTTDTEYCHLLINSTGKLVSSFDVKSALEPLASIKEIPLSKLAVFENELPVARLLVESIGGEMKLSRAEQNGLMVQISLPSKR